MSAESVERTDAPEPRPRAILSRAEAVGGLCAMLIAMGWDRAVWLMTTRAGVPRLGWLEGLYGVPAVWRAAGAGAVQEALLAAGYTVVYAFGRVWIWLALGALIVFGGFVQPDAEGAKRSIRRGVFVVLVPIAAGIGAELLKLLSRRMRPETGDGFYRFKPLAGALTSPEFWSTSGLGLASSHASVAVGAALAAGLVLPRWRWALAAMAALCCLSRLAVGAHYLSDVLAGAAIGVLCFRAIYAWDRRNNAGAPMPSGWRTLLSR